MSASVFCVPTLKENVRECNSCRPPSNMQKVGPYKDVLTWDVVTRELFLDDIVRGCLILIQGPLSSDTRLSGFG
jgi:hypothetical protein